MALRRDGIRVRRGPLSLVYLDDGRDEVRVAYAMTKRIGTAVVRNRLRRRLRAVVAEVERQGTPPLPRGALLISAGPEASRRRPDELRNDVASLLAALETRRTGRVAP